MNTYPASYEKKIEWKQTLKNACLQIIHKRIANIEQAMQEARESANNEEKSSAGDKYETSRAMGHLAQEMQSRQLEDAKADLDFISRLNTRVLATSATTGAVVICTDMIFYIAGGLGNTRINNSSVMLLSPRAPIALMLHHKKTGDTFEFNKKTITITSIF